nr:winged helix-turn-helix domain-containing protein [Bacillus cereus]
MQFGQESFWNTRNIQYIIKEKFAICMSREGICKMLHRMNFSYTNATYILKKANKEKQIQFQKQLDMIKNLIDEIPYSCIKMNVTLEIVKPFMLHGLRRETKENCSIRKAYFNVFIRYN